MTHIDLTYEDRSSIQDVDNGRTKKPNIFIYATKIGVAGGLYTLAIIGGTVLIEVAKLNGCFVLLNTHPQRFQS
jgi:hypothetical protein